GPQMAVRAAEAALPLNVLAPVPQEPPIEGDWIPKKEVGVKLDGDAFEFEPLVPTAYPNLKIPENWEKDASRRAEECRKKYGDKGPLTMPPPDDTYRRSLIARLQQGQIEMGKNIEVIEIGRWHPMYFAAVLECLTDMQNVAIELWGNDPNTLIYCL